MPTETNTGAADGQAPAGAQPQEGASQAQAADAQSPQAGSADSGSGTEDVAQLRREREAANREAHRLRTELKTHQDAQRQAEEAKLSEAERLSRRHAELESENGTLKSQLREERTRNRVLSAASRLGYRDPGDAFSLLDRSSLEYGDDGEPKHIDRLLGELLRAKPYLGNTALLPRGGSGEGGPRGGADAGPGMNDLLRQAAGRTS